MTQPEKKAPAKKAKSTAKKAAPKKAAPKKTAVKKAPAKRVSSNAVGMKKEYLKSRKICKVTFRLPKIAAPKAKSVCLVGEFNNWNMYANPMKKLKNGNYTLTLVLKPGKEYQFRYLIDGNKWENDWNADKYVRNPYGDSDNSVIII